MYLKLLSNPIFLIFLSVFFGIYIGKIRIGEFRFGYSGALMVSLVVSWISMKILLNNGYSTTYELIPKSFFIFSLVLFISSIGLIAGKNITFIMKKYGVKFLLLAIIITATGYVSTELFKIIFNVKNTGLLSGIFTGALTSTPGLATALENAKNSNIAGQAGLGYAICYVPGVLAVIFSMYLLPIIFKINTKKELENLTKLRETIKEGKGVKFDFIAYSLVVIVGIILGTFKIHISGGFFSLGTTGGVLISSLTFGNIKKIKNLRFDMDEKILNVLKELGLLLFLTSVGLRYGYESLNSVNLSSLFYLLASFVIAILAILIGFVIGRYMFKMNWIILAGAISGGMSSTPGLGAAIDATKSNDPTHGYGATYPFALIFMVIFVMAILKF